MDAVTTAQGCGQGDLGSDRMTRLMRVSTGSSADLLEHIFAVLLPDARTALDMTFGSGKFWKPDTAIIVTGMDRNPARARNVCADFTALPFAGRSFDVAIFDPPYHTESGRSLISHRFGSYATIPALREAVETGCREAWRVARLGVVVKVQDYCHASRYIRMTRWVEDALAPAEMYDEVHLVSPSKIEDPKWGDQLSVRSNATTWLIYRKDGPVHKRRKSLASHTHHQP
jgi:hypothetical protein